MQYSHGDELEGVTGKIININNYEFDHNIKTEAGSSGSPITLLSNSKVIKLGDKNKNLNIGIFIGEIFNINNNKYFKDKTIPKI